MFRVHRRNLQESAGNGVVQGQLDDFIIFIDIFVVEWKYCRTK